MATLTIRVTDQKAERLKTMAEQRGISVNKLMDELATHALAEFDAETRFHMRAARGSRERGLATLAMLDEHYANPALRQQPETAYPTLHDSAQSSYSHKKDD